MVANTPVPGAPAPVAFAPGAPGPVVAVVDYHKGNLSSVERGLASVGARVLVTDDPRAIAGCDAAVVPGVGAFEDASSYMRESGQAEAVLSLVSRGRPVLGICLGMQLLFDRGDESSAALAGGCCGSFDGAASCDPVPRDPAFSHEPGHVWTPGLALMAGDVVRISAEGVKVPHVGWNSVELTPQAAACPLFAGVGSGAYYYFTHSYVCVPASPRVVVGETEHGARFASAVWDGGCVFGTQFHPEKSSDAGQALLANFVSFVKGGGR